MMKHTVDQLFTKLPTVFPADHAQASKRQFDELHNRIDTNDEYIRKINETSKTVKSSVDQVRIALRRQSDEIKSLNALQDRCQESTTQLDTSIARLHRTVVDVTRLVQGAYPREQTNGFISPIQIPSNFFAVLHDELAEQANEINNKLNSLERTVAFHQKSSEITDPQQTASLIEGTIRLQYAQYKQLASVVSKLQNRLAALQDGNSRLGLTGAYP